MTLPAPAQVGALLEAAPEWFRAFIALAAFAGLRLGEAPGVQLGDVDFLRRVLQVTRQIQPGPDGELEDTPPKYGSERPVFLADGLLELLSAHAVRVPAKGKRWLFAGRGGGLLPPTTVGYRWRTTCRLAEVDGITFHDLRHFYASGLIAQGCDVVTVQKALGHAKATTTLAIYAHLWPTAEDKTRNAAGALVDEVLSARNARPNAADSVRTGAA